MPTASLFQEYHTFLCRKDGLIGREIVLRLFAHQSTNFSLACGYHMWFVCYIGKALLEDINISPSFDLDPIIAVAPTCCCYECGFSQTFPTPSKTKQKPDNWDTAQHVKSVMLWPWPYAPRWPCSVHGLPQTHLALMIKMVNSLTDQLNCQCCHKMNKNQIHKSSYKTSKFVFIIHL